MKALAMVQGGIAITLLDSLDSLLVFGRLDDFREAERLTQRLDFDRPERAHVFETTIRYAALQPHAPAPLVSDQSRANPTDDGLLVLGSLRGDAPYIWCVESNNTAS